jgi:hypothetical protein
MNSNRKNYKNGQQSKCFYSATLTKINPVVSRKKQVQRMIPKILHEGYKGLHVVVQLLSLKRNSDQYFIDLRARCISLIPAVHGKATFDDL